MNKYDKYFGNYIPVIGQKAVINNEIHTVISFETNTPRQEIVAKSSTTGIHRSYASHNVRLIPFTTLDIPGD